MLVSPVSLLASLETNLTEGHRDEKSQMPGHHVQPELVVDGGAGREVGHVLADRGGEESEQGLSAKGRDANVRRDEPACGGCHQDGRVLLDPVGGIGIGTNDDGLPANAGGRLGDESCGGYRAGSIVRRVRASYRIQMSRGERRTPSRGCKGRCHVFPEKPTIEHRGNGHVSRPRSGIEIDLISETSIDMNGKTDCDAKHTRLWR